MSQPEKLSKYFQKCLHRGKGDLEAMLSGIRFRIEHDGQLLDPHKVPPAYRSEKLREYLREKGAHRTTLCGPTALRGDLNPKTKTHIIEFLKLVNKLPADKETLKKALDMCADLYVQKINSQTSTISIANTSNVQAAVAQLFSTHGTRATAGKLPQGLIYAILRLKYAKQNGDFSVVSKRTHAGDTQSGSPGDVRILEGNKLYAVFEVKGLKLDQFAIAKILPTHGRHEYPLFILGLDFVPYGLKAKLNGLENTFAINLEDYFWTVFSELTVAMKLSTSEILKQIIAIYNDEFCGNIEQDNTVRIEF